MPLATLALPLLLAAVQLRSSPAGGSEQGSCRPDSVGPRLDHVVVAVRDLDAAAARFASLGFRFKMGRLHPNNLLNRHIKFRDGTELELMTVQGRAGDRMAQEYADLLAAGDGGAYVALKAPDLDLVAAAAQPLGLPVQRSASGAWQFLGFPASSDAAAVFFVSGGVAPADPDSIFAHADGSSGLVEAWLEGGPALNRLLRAAGASTCETITLPDGRTGPRWALGSGYLVVVQPARPDVTPRVLGVVLAGEGSKATNRRETIQPLPGFWLGYR
jgi:hypothetical protein